MGRVVFKQPAEFRDTGEQKEKDEGGNSAKVA
jgi:hypothetical protein